MALIVNLESIKNNVPPSLKIHLPSKSAQGPSIACRPSQYVQEESFTTIMEALNKKMDA
jgi:hypothetical protein